MKKLAVICALVLLASSLSAFLPSASDFALCDNIIRLHVIANSDTEPDQAEKLRVRDEVLNLVGSKLTAENKEDAERELRALLPEITSAASEILPEDRPVTATLTTEPYPRKSYGPVTLPAGSYTSLRVIIGDGEGHNWWCVLFPRMCTSPASDEGELRRQFVEAGFTPSQYKIITESNNVRYTVKFKIVEMIRSLFK